MFSTVVNKETGPVEHPDLTARYIPETGEVLLLEAHGFNNKDLVNILDMLQTQAQFGCPLPGDEIPPNVEFVQGVPEGMSACIVREVDNSNNGSLYFYVNPGTAYNASVPCSDNAFCTDAIRAHSFPSGNPEAGPYILTDGPYPFMVKLDFEGGLVKVQTGFGEFQELALQDAINIFLSPNNVVSREQFEALEIPLPPMTPGAIDASINGLVGLIAVISAIGVFNAVLYGIQNFKMPSFGEKKEEKK